LLKEDNIKKNKRRYKRYTIKQKQELLLEADNTGNCISLTARKYGVSPSAMFEWRKQTSEGALAGLSITKNWFLYHKLKSLRLSFVS
jgi:transposase-like protein